MEGTSKKLGRLIAEHSTSPASLQRASIVAVVSFLFFGAMMLAFYVRGWAGYFGLATAFLVVNLFTLIGVWLQKRNVVRVYENGISYRRAAIMWKEVTGFRLAPGSGLELRRYGTDPVIIPPSTSGLAQLADLIKQRRDAA